MKNHWLLQSRQRNNPIINFDGRADDLIPWGKKTLERKPTAMDRICVRRMMFYIQKRMREILRSNRTEITEEVINASVDLLEDIRSRKGCSSYSVDYSHDKIQIGFVPIRGVESILLNLEIKRI
tara:strand:- start:369 stop:740 length:372 start_codon:yes stop_codon:yes gene_type:complete